jgi:trans-aconitate 2-methyltransferase
MAWDPNQYLKFSGLRLRPALDLLAQVPAERPRTVCDLGAGTGNVTRLLRERWPDAAITGVDSSAEMLDKARTDAPGITWQQADLAAWAPDAPVDVIFSNAALHWIGDHARVFTRLAGALAPGGVLAVQMPRNFAAPSHTLMADAARNGPWRATLEPLLRPAPVSEPAFYYDVLVRCGTRPTIWETEYIQALEGADPVKEWTKGTWLKPLLDALDEPQRGAFEAAYTERVAAAYPRRDDGITLFPFRRLFIVATMPE